MSTIDALKHNGYATPEEFVLRAFWDSENIPSTVMLVGADGKSYTYKVEGCRYYNLFAKTEDGEYTLVKFLDFRD